MENKEKLKNIIECLLFVSSKSISVKKLVNVIKDTNAQEVLEVIQDLANDYNNLNKPIFIQNVANGWRMATRSEYGVWVKEFFSKEITYRLSSAALEVLAIVTYRQPVTIMEIENIRGVSSGGVLRNLLEKGLIKIAGRKEVPGRPVLYRTTAKFLEYFGLESISDIPPLEELGFDKEMDELMNEAKSLSSDLEQKEDVSEEDLETRSGSNEFQDEDFDEKEEGSDNETGVDEYPGPETVEVTESGDSSKEILNETNKTED